MPTSLFILAAALLFVFWLTQLLDLLRRTDEEFPSRSDRVVWTLVILFLPALGAILYWLLKPSDVPVMSPDSLKSELSNVMAARNKTAGNSGEAG